MRERAGVRLCYFQYFVMASFELVRGFLEKILAPKQERTMNVPQRNRKRGQDMEL